MGVRLDELASAMLGGRMGALLGRHGRMGAVLGRRKALCWAGAWVLCWMGARVLCYAGAGAEYLSWRYVRGSWGNEMLEKAKCPFHSPIQATQAGVASDGQLSKEKPIHRIVKVNVSQMRRTKLSMDLRSDEKYSRSNAAFLVRKNGLKKKCAELSTLCGINVCMVVFAPEHEPDFWPANRCKLLDLFEKYRNQPSGDRKKRTVSLCDFLDDRKRKAETMLMKFWKLNEETMPSEMDELYNNMTEEELQEVEGSLQTKIVEMQAKLDVVKANQRVEASSLHLPNQPSSVMHSSMFRTRSMDLEVIPEQPISTLDTHDQCNQIQLGLSFDITAMADPMMSIFVKDYENGQLDGTSWTSFLCAPLSGPSEYHEPITGTLENGIMDNQTATPATRMDQCHEINLQGHVSQIDESYT
ncbi:hypothetical protein RJ640_021061 [Escallonia rubra]|uniref:MADS-box domain-containing protein n=1 Tax=Escallonia rubra TaxID=112253 RepID=A0AA88UB78_9ASTE|nr:hypothetical protein RJ640_021061 [Escallonia rubra]